MINFQNLKKDFPIFKYHPNLVYLDSTATSLKPKVVIDKVREYYEKYSANVFRGIYQISEKATEEYEETRQVVAKFINAKSSDEVIFTRNTTESINLVAYSLGREIVGKGDEVVVSIMEHHSNFVPWQMLAFEVGADFKVIDVDREGYLQIKKSKVKSQSYNSKVKIEGLEDIVSKRTKILALTYVSNVLGTINPIKEIVKTAKEINPKIITVVDAAQAVPHMKVNVQDLSCDFLSFSSHKMLGPTGIGILWGKEEILRDMFPFNFGGEMVLEVYIDKTTFKEPPHKFEAGTPDIAGAIALKEAVRYLSNLGMEKVRRHEIKLTDYALKRLKEEFKEKIAILGPKNIEERGGIVSFTFKKYHPHDIAQILDEENIAIRAGHHCAMPLHKRLGIEASARASFYIYNDKEEVEKLIEGLRKVEKVLG